MNFATKRQLTKEGHNRSEWVLPDCMKNVDITYHEGSSYGWMENLGIFKSAARGQEFVVKTDVTEEILNWIKDIITD